MPPKKLPDELIVIPNADKKFHEKWHKGRNMLNFPHPFRAVCLGPPNKGKSTTVKNILLRADPPFEEVKVIHCDGDYTKEYEDVDADMLSEIPAPAEWGGVVKTLVILDDLELKGMSKEQKRNLDRLVGYVSTHKNISVILCSQDPFNVPPIVRRCSNLWILYEGTDRDSVAQLSRKAGYTKEQFDILFDKCTEFHDSIWLDKTSKSPYPLRKNGFEIIKL
tara:strand:+ start:4584 stop:5246 length:663 start_codon:yes stop_codon:yes gene_type:complete